MARFMRAIHVFLPRGQDVDAPDKPGHDERKNGAYPHPHSFTNRLTATMLRASS